MTSSCRAIGADSDRAVAVPPIRFPDFPSRRALNLDLLESDHQTRLSQSRRKQRREEAMIAGLSGLRSETLTSRIALN